MDGLVKRPHGLIARATAGGQTRRTRGGSRAVLAVWQDRGCDAPPLITSDLVVSPFQVELPSDVTALGDRHTVQLVHLCEDVCRYLFLRHVAVSAVEWWRLVTGEWIPEGVPEKLLSCPSGRFQIGMADTRARRRGESIHARRTVPEHPPSANAGQRSREAQLSLFSGAVGPAGSVETSLRFSWKLSICLAAAALSRLPPRR